MASCSRVALGHRVARALEVEAEQAALAASSSTTSTSGRRPWVARARRPGLHAGTDADSVPADTGVVAARGREPERRTAAHSVSTPTFAALVLTSRRVMARPRPVPS